MSYTALKRLNVSDVFTIPYEANKQWSVTSSKFNEDGITFNIAINTTGSFNPVTSQITNNQYDLLMYKSLLANYYPEFYPTNSLSTSSYYQTVNYTNTLTSTDNAVSGALRLGNPYSTEKFFPTEIGSTVLAINIPTDLFSGKVLPTSFEMEIDGGKIYDDGEYNLRYSGITQGSSVGLVISQSSYVGNIFYEQGLGVLTVIPNSIPLPPPTPLPVGYQVVVLWLSQNTSADPNYSLYYAYKDTTGVYQIQDFSKAALNSPSLLGTIVTEEVGSGFWFSFFGDTLKTNKKVIPGAVVPQSFIFAPGATNVYAISSPGATFYYYTTPPDPTSTAPPALTGITTIAGYSVFGETYNDGVTYY